MEHTGESSYVFVAERWEMAIDYATHALSCLREIYPDYYWHVRVETANSAIESAISKLQGSITELHRAGRHVLGAEQYETFCEERSSTVEHELHVDQTKDSVGHIFERGDT